MRELNLVKKEFKKFDVEYRYFKGSKESLISIKITQKYQGVSWKDRYILISEDKPVFKNLYKNIFGG